MNEQPLVSVLTPAYNAEAFLPETVGSIRNQSYSNFEYVLIDDHSTDGTWSFIQGAARDDARIRPLRNPENMKIARTRNRCVEEARGKYVIWQDADDVSLPNRIERLVAHMEAHPNTGICGSYLQLFNEDGDLDVRRYPTSDKDIRRKAFKFAPISQPAAIIRRECYAKAGIYDDSYVNCEDLDMTFRIGMHYELANVPEVLLRYREHQKSTTLVDMHVMLKDTLKIRLKYNDGKHYKMGGSDWLAWLATATALALPPFAVIRLFKMQRAMLLRAAGR